MTEQIEYPYSKTYTYEREYTNKDGTVKTCKKRVHYTVKGRARSGRKVTVYPDDVIESILTAHKNGKPVSYSCCEHDLSRFIVGRIIAA